MIDRYYYYEDETRTVFHSTSELFRPDLIFLGVTDNPNIKMAAAYFTKNMKQRMNHKIKELVE